MLSTPLAWLNHKLDDEEVYGGVLEAKMIPVVRAPQRRLLRDSKVRIVKNLLHVTNQLYKEGILGQIRWKYCNRIHNFQCCQYHTMIRVLPEEPNYFSPNPASPVVDAILACAPAMAPPDIVSVS